MVPLSAGEAGRAVLPFWGGPWWVTPSFRVHTDDADCFPVAAAFGNVHGVYKPGNVKLKPSILGDSQKFVAQERKLGPKPINFVFHGGSGSSREEIREAISYGAIKMNIDTDTQWASWDGILNYYKKNEAYLQGQLGNPEGPDAPNKKYYDPRVWLRKMEESMSARLEAAFDDLNCRDVL